MFLAAQWVVVWGGASTSSHEILQVQVDLSTASSLQVRVECEGGRCPPLRFPSNKCIATSSDALATPDRPLDN